MKIALLAALLILTGCATAPVKHAAVTPVIGALEIPDDGPQPKLDPRIFESFNEAAVAAIQLSYDLSNAYEHSGGIVETPEFKFQITIPATDYSGDEVAGVEYKKARYVQVADYHTHPCLPYSHFVKWFSPEDIQEAGRKSAVMGNMCTGEVNRYTPGFDPAGNYITKNYNGDPVTLTTGHVIGLINVYKVPKLMEGPSPEAPDLLCPLDP